MVHDWGQARELLEAASQQSGLQYGALRSLRRQVLLKHNAHNTKSLDASRIEELAGRLVTVSVLKLATMYQHSPVAIAKALLKLNVSGKKREKVLETLSEVDKTLLEVASANDIVLTIDPRVDELRLTMATAFEGSLQSFLAAQGVAFDTEKEQKLTHKGEESLTVTPDCLLKTPIEIAGKQVHWIDGVPLHLYSSFAPLSHPLAQAFREAFFSHPTNSLSFPVFLFRRMNLMALQLAKGIRYSFLSLPLGACAAKNFYGYGRSFFITKLKKQAAKYDKVPLH
jgi:hypothetical protein